LGGDPDAIPPSLGGAPTRHREPGERVLEYRGKIRDLLYDRFGDFEGFVLDTEDGTRHFESREHEVERVVRRAWEERTFVVVAVESDDRDRAMRIVLSGPPSREW
jgi:hypothetical protein